MSIDRPEVVALLRAFGSDGDPVELLTALRALYQEVDHEIDLLVDGLELPCRSGCAFCCHESVFVSAIEFLNVADVLLALPVSYRTRIVEEMKQIAERFEDELELLESITPGAERDEVAARVKFRCPLLDEADRCSIYQARELNGRTFGQTWDGDRDHPFGCELTHEYLEQQGRSLTLFDARQARRMLRDRFDPSLLVVHVYPWWFDRFGHYLL